MRNLLITILIFLCSIAFAQEEAKTSIKGGAKALIFEFNGLDNLSADSFNGGIGGKIFFSRNLALRVGFDWDRMSETLPANPSQDETGIDGSYVSTTFGLSAALEIHTNSKSRVSPYFGGGFGYSRNSWERKYDDTYAPTAPSYRQIDEQTGNWELGFFGLLGAEFFIVKEVSLSAEYNFTMAFFNEGDLKTRYVITNGTPAFIPQNMTTDGNSGWSINTGSHGRLLLSIYF